MVNLDELTALSDLRERLSRVTPEQIDGAGRKLGRKESDGEKPIGTITATATRTLYTLWRQLVAEEVLERALAGTAPNEIEETDHIHKSCLLDMFADIVRELFWAQARIDLGFYNRACVGVRTDWLLVETPHSAHMPPDIGGILSAMGGGFGGGGV